MEGIHQVGIQMNPMHQFLARGSGGNVGAIELCQLSFAISFDFHFIIHFINVIQSEAKDLECVNFMLPRSFLPSVVWMTKKEAPYDTNIFIYYKFTK